ncbi:shikimate kinase [Spirochaetota bacterium]|nr:shikimate kinase [Spirochaetota bacterium]
MNVTIPPSRNHPPATKYPPTSLKITPQPQSAKNKHTQIIAFIGYRGSGKSTIARALAQKLKYPIYSSDQLIEKTTKSTIASLITKKGWASFRTHEFTVIKTLLDNHFLSKKHPKIILDCGGGVVENTSLMDILSHSQVFIVYVKCSFPKILHRLERTPRPSLIPDLTLYEETKRKLNERTPLYEKYAHYTLHNYRHPNLVLATLLKHLTHRKFIIS